MPLMDAPAPSRQPQSPRASTAAAVATHRKNSGGAWSIPVGESVVLVDDVKALKQAVHEVRPFTSCPCYACILNAHLYSERKLTLCECMCVSLCMHLI